jgi:hypothetical protein
MVDPKYALTGRYNPYQLSGTVNNLKSDARTRFLSNYQEPEANPVAPVVENPVIANETGVVDTSQLVDTYMPNQVGNKYVSPDPGQGNMGLYPQIPNISPTTLTSALKISKLYGPTSLLHPSVGLPLVAGNALYNALGGPSLSEIGSTIKDTAMTLTDSLGMTTPEEGMPRSDSLLSGLASSNYTNAYGAPSVYSGFGNANAGGYDIGLQGTPSAYSGVGDSYSKKKEKTASGYSSPKSSGAYTGNSAGSYSGGGYGGY